MNRRELMQAPALLGAAGFAQDGAAGRAALRLSFTRSAGPMRMEQMALGQGGLSPEPMWESRAAEIRALRPALIRLFVQEYFNLQPAPGQYDFSVLDRSIDLILSTGAKPLPAICFKPRTLFPAVDQDIVEPADYRQWEELVYRLVRHYRERGAGIRYWEAGNEPDIGEDGGCPYRFKPESYVRYYRHTAAAIRRADPEARVGGPALANVKSPILPALLESSASGAAPLDFISWHIYSSEPQRIRGTIDFAKSLLRKHPSLHPETFLNEWNMSLSDPVQDPRFQPCFIVETVWQMKEAGLDWSCYYHIRDYHVDQRQFAHFMSPRGAAFMARWWNRMPQFDGLFDYQNSVRPSYFAFKLLSRLAGERLEAVSTHPAVHAFLSWDETYRLYNLLFWNYSTSPVEVDIRWEDVPRNLRVRRIALDAATPSSDENHRLRPIGRLRVAAGAGGAQAALDPYGVEFWYFED